MSGKADYHVHYYMDSCSSDAMTLANIAPAALKAGLDEIAVLKHYSANLPNNDAHWVYWHKIIPEQFDQFIFDVKNYDGFPKIYSGVETELVNEDGDINIEYEAQQKLDMAALSVHYIPNMKALDLNRDNYPDFRALTDEWHNKVENVGIETIIQGLVNGYCNAIRKNPKVRTLAHMADGLLSLRTFAVNVDTIESSRLVKMMEPLMVCMREHDVLWEIAKDRPRQEVIVLHANELGVRFCATADAHFIEGGWANIPEHEVAENIIDELKLNRGRINF
ncbi:MAG: PHP domain-containing protein [Oscillospiraceae bacterium]|nr:PHP domain-containing protein [Oscillospiraceae bacterium]